MVCKMTVISPSRTTNTIVFLSVQLIPLVEWPLILRSAVKARTSLGQVKMCSPEEGEEMVGRPQSSGVLHGIGSHLVAFLYQNIMRGSRYFRFIFKKKSWL